MSSNDIVRTDRLVGNKTDTITAMPERFLMAADIGVDGPKAIDVRENGRNVENMSKEVVLGKRTEDVHEEDFRIRYEKI